MKWKNFKLKTKFTFAFGGIILLLAVVAYWSIFGINGIIGNANEVIDGNKLRTELETRYVQHLKWASQVREFLSNDNVTELTVQLDHTQCDFGKWFYGDGKKQALELAPGLEPLLAEMESPHQHLHESAVKIKNTFEQADRTLSSNLREAKVDHLIFAHRIKDVAVNAEQIDQIDVQKNPTLCNFGKWLYSSETEELKRKYPEFASICRRVEEPHNNLHRYVETMEGHFRSGNIEVGKNYYMNTIKPGTYAVLDVIDEMIAWNDFKLTGMDAAGIIYEQETMKHLGDIGQMFGNVIDESKDLIMTDEVMLQEANNTRSGVLIFSVIAAIVALILAYIITMGILVPVKKGVKFAEEVANGNLNSTVDVDQEDEIGVLANALKGMVMKLREIVSNIMLGADNIAEASQQMSSSSQQMSQGASEQASSAEEVSSSMEEMVSNIEQNTDNAMQTEKITTMAVDRIKKGNESAAQSAESMKNIADKISIISEIAFQTNILALNAAVEAARAGEHGKGFAVVAAEVRKLAERSKVAAEEIDQVSKSGVSIAEKAGKELAEIVPEIEKTAKLVQEIAAASTEQSSGAEQVNTAIQQLNQVTQQNAAASEELATSSEELAGQADQLKQIISYFDVDNSGSSGYTHFQAKKKPLSNKNLSMERKTDTRSGEGVNINLKEKVFESDDGFEKF